MSVALNTIGFCLSLKSLLQSFDIHVLDSYTGLMFVGIISICIMGILCCMGMDDEAKVS